MAYSVVVSNTISDNNIKLTADKIIQILDQVREEGKKSKRRWIWELIQNAKDVPNCYNQVSIEIELTDKELVFSHNGNPFSIANLTGLVQQVSSKHSGSIDSEVTGKFGTGFLSTHLLSEIIIVEGVLQEPNEIPQNFSLTLDRSGVNSEDLMPSIRKALEELNDIDKSDRFKPFPEYEEIRNESCHFSKFRYILEENTLTTALIGLDDLILTMPITLSFIEKIKQIRVIDKVNQRRLLFKRNIPTSSSGDYTDITISVIDENNSELEVKHKFIIQTKDNVQMLAEVSDFHESNLLTISNRIPYLFRDFPLIGTEEFYFPFILNGKSFYPTERRDSIFLNGNNSKAQHNKAILEKAISNAISFVDELLNRNIKNLCSTCLSNLPNYEFDQDEKTLEWYVDSIQSKYRSELATRKIVLHPNGPFALNEIRFPTSDEHDNSDLRQLITEYLGANVTPLSDEQELWVKYLGPDEQIHTWGWKMKFGLHDLAEEIGSSVGLNKLNSISDKFLWLNKLYDLIIQLNQDDLHRSFPLVLNHKGNLRKKAEIFLEEVSEEIPSYLPNSFLELLKKLGPDWTDDLLNRNLVLNREHQKKSMSDLNTAINSFFNSNDFILRESSVDLLINVHSIIPPGSKEDSFQRQLLKHASILFGKKINLIVENNTSKFNYEVSSKLLIKSINKKLDEIGSIKNLDKVLSDSPTTAVNWLNEYLQFLESNRTQSAAYLKEGKIIPNRTQEGQFCLYDDLFGFGTNEQALDENLLSILLKLNPKKNLFEKLIADGIYISLGKQITFEKLGNDLVSEVERIDFERSHSIHREPLLELINWCEENESLAKRYTGKLPSLAGRLFYVLTIEDSNYRKDVMTILKNGSNLHKLAKISNNAVIVSQMENLVQLFPKGFPPSLMEFAKEEARKKKEFNSMLELGSKMERLLVEALHTYVVDSDREKIIHAGGGSYDIRIFNPINNKSTYVELKSVRHNNLDSINMAVSQVNRSIKEGRNFTLVIIERTSDNQNMDVEYIKSNLRCINNIGNHLTTIQKNYADVESKTNQNEIFDLRMEYAEFKGTIDYEWLKNNSEDFFALIQYIKTNIS